MLDPTHEVEAMEERWLRRELLLRGRAELAPVRCCGGCPGNIVERAGGHPPDLVGGRPVLRPPRVYAGDVPCAARPPAVACAKRRAEGAATYIGLVVSVLNGVLGMVEVVGALLLLSSLSLRGGM